MKATVTINARGVITLPAKIREALGLKAEDALIAETTPEGLLLRPAITLPIETYSAEREREFDAAESELAAYLHGKSGRAKHKAAKAEPGVASRDIEGGEPRKAPNPKRPRSSRRKAAH